MKKNVFRYGFFLLLSFSSSMTFAGELYVWNGQWSQATAGGMCGTNHSNSVFVPNTQLTQSNAQTKCRNAIDLKNLQIFGKRCMPSTASRCAYLIGSK
ncbi:MAG: hypothetical protein V4525_05375 [Pseudomonadota bacterium]